MIVDPELYKKETGRNFFDDYCFNYPEEDPPPIHILKSETGLPVNVLDVEYSVTLEWGMWALIKFQNNTADEIDDSNSFELYFDENANLFPVYDLCDILISEDDFHAVQDFVKKSAADETSRLNILMKERKAQWEAAVKETAEKNRESR